MAGKRKQTPRKDKDSAKPNHPVIENDAKECVLTFPQLKTLDNVKFLPRYTAVLSRMEEEGVSMEDLDTLQLELEALLSSVAVRMRALQGEIQTLNIIGEKKDKKGKVLVGKPSFSPRKRSRQEDRPVKKLKEVTGKTRDLQQPSSKIQAVNGVSLPDVGRTNILDAKLPGIPQPEVPKIVLPKNDTPNKFWASIESFFAEITSEDLKLLEDQILAHQHDAEYQKIPVLGQHYTLQWAEEELEEHEEVSVHGGKKQKQSCEVSAKLKYLNKRSSKCTAGPLSQRLVSALINENIMNSEQECLDTENDDENTSSNVDMDVLENRVKRELEEQGILEPVEPSKDQADDEILNELRRCQNQLAIISNHNLQQLRMLLKLAQHEHKRQEYRRKFHQTDLEVMDLYRKTTTAKQKKTPLSKKEKEQVWRVLRERELLLKRLNSVD